jgi:hypothetical protein
MRPRMSCDFELAEGLVLGIPSGTSHPSDIFITCMSLVMGKSRLSDADKSALPRPALQCSGTRTNTLCHTDGGQTRS